VEGNSPFSLSSTNFLVIKTVGQKTSDSRRTQEHQQYNSS